ncbi:MAG: ATP-binding protein [Christensenellales bacterium]|jgi:anti-sigma regulatory factor (Ser/Thr protein kinase)
MQEIALHILDILQNAIAAGAKLIRLVIRVDTRRDELEIVVEDDGCGMDQETARRVMSPFATSRTTRKVGLGIPLFAQSCRASGGDLVIASEKGAGTTLTAGYKLSHIDRPPMGDLAATVAAAVLSDPDIDYIYEHKANDEQACLLDTRRMRRVLGGEISLSETNIIDWIRRSVYEELNALNERNGTDEIS